MRVSGLNWHGLMEQLKDALPYCQVTDHTLAYFNYPRRSIKVNVPLRMDNGEIRLFQGYRAVHSTARGPSLGGLRFREDLSRHECEVLAAIATLQAAVADLPLGGSAGGIDVDPETLSERELQGLTRRYTSELIDSIGPYKDIVSPDIGTDSQNMAWVYDAYNEVKNSSIAGVAVGKPLPLGGSYGTKDGRGQSAAKALLNTFKRDQIAIKGARVAILGFGDVGSKAAALLAEAGAMIVAVSDRHGATFASSGLNLERLAKHREKNGTVGGFGLGITENELLELDVDAIVLAHDFGNISAGNVQSIRAKYLVEASARAVLPEAERYLTDKNIRVIPDLVAGIGGVVANYLEWVQSHTSFFWTSEEIEAVVEKHINMALEDVHGLMDKHGISMRTAAYAIAIERIATATEQRGVYP